jgi:molybdenum cofactor synthesis domain-containing protein
VIGEAELEVTQIGKKCHGHTCSIFREVGACIMPKEGLFCRVTKSGAIRQGDAITYLPQSLRVLIVTVSDRASRGEYADLSGPEIRKSMDAYGAAARMRSTFDAVIIPDDAQRIRAVLDDAVAKAYDLVLMTGGTGIGPRDVTADVVAEVIEKELPGIMEFVRQKYGTQHPNALLSRSIAGTAGGTLLFAMPGSPKAVREYMSEIANVLTHCVFMLRGIGVH